MSAYVQMWPYSGPGGGTAAMTATFLGDRDGRTWESDRIEWPATYHLGAGPSQLEVVVILTGMCHCDHPIRLAPLQPFLAVRAHIAQ